MLMLFWYYSVAITLGAESENLRNQSDEDPLIGEYYKSPHHGACKNEGFSWKEFRCSKHNNAFLPIPVNLEPEHKGFMKNNEEVLNAEEHNEFIRLNNHEESSQLFQIPQTHNAESVLTLLNPAEQTELREFLSSIENNPLH